MPPWLQIVLSVLAGTLGIATFLRTVLESQRKELREDLGDVKRELGEVRTAVHSLEVRFAERFGASPPTPAE